MHHINGFVASALALLGLALNSSAYKVHLSFPPRKLSTAQTTIREQQTPAQDRFLFVDGLISQPATIVPKLFGDKPFWVPHAFQNLCPFVRGPDIDPVWSAGCAPLPYPAMGSVNPGNMQEMYIRFQALQQAQQAQEEQAQREADNAPSWWEQFVPAGPADYGMAQMYGPVQQQDMSQYYYNAAAADSSKTVNSRGGGRRAVSPHQQPKVTPMKGMSWLGGGGFWG